MDVVLVGYGGIAAVHAQALAALGHRVAAVVGPNLARAEAFAAARKIRTAATDLAAVLDDSGADCVHVTSPPAFHEEALLTALARGCHVVSEKPLCLSSEAAKRLREEADRRGVVHAVCFNQRYQPAVLAIRDRVGADAFGPPRLISGSYKQSFHLLPTAYGWRYDETKAGRLRAVSEIGSHWLDLAAFVLGSELVSVAASFLNVAPRRRLVDGIMDRAGGGERPDLLVQSEDAAALTLTYESGTLGHVLLSEISPGYYNRIELEISADGETLAWTNEGGGLTVSDGRSKRTTRAFPALAFEQTFTAMFDDVYRVIGRGGSGTFATFADAEKNVAAAEAAAASAASGSAPVFLKKS